MSETLDILLFLAVLAGYLLMAAGLIRITKATYRRFAEQRHTERKKR